jgi:6-phosphofructokinase 1
MSESEEERQIRESLDPAGLEFVTDPARLGARLSRDVPNPILDDDDRQTSLGPDSRRAVTVDLDLLQRAQRKFGRLPGFLAAGPRTTLHFDPVSVRVAIVTSGGVCPGLNTVVDQIVRRHALYSTRRDPRGGNPSILGFTNGFRGFIDGTYLALHPALTESWPRRGGSMLRQLRETEVSRPAAAKIVAALHRFAIDVLYVAGGDGSLQTASDIRRLVGPDGNIGVVHVPKTMDNDIPWVSESFGFQTAIAEAARLLNAIRDEAESNNRIAVVEVMGAGMGHTATHTALASGEIDAVLIPEQGPIDIQRLLDHLDERALGPGRKGYAVILAAEKVQPSLDLDHPSASVLVQGLERRFPMRGVKSRVFVNQPKHLIRAVPANCQDQLYCRQLANCVVDCALAGYTGFSLSKWLDSYVMVPFVRTVGRRKHLPLGGMVWKQVQNLTGQPKFS